jgi:hypothetical protein
MRCLPSLFAFFVFAMSQFDWPITKKEKKKETMEAPPNRRFYFEV